ARRYGFTTGRIFVFYLHAKRILTMRQPIALFYIKIGLFRSIFRFRAQNIIGVSLLYTVMLHKLNANADLGLELAICIFNKRNIIAFYRNIGFKITGTRWGVKRRTTQIAIIGGTIVLSKATKTY